MVGTMIIRIQEKDTVNHMYSVIQYSVIQF